MSKNNVIYILSSLLFVTILVSIYLVWHLQSQPNQPSPPLSDDIFCPDDIMICPDGSSVARLPPTCSFAPCPDTPPQPTTTDTSSWQTYTNPEHQFEIKIPKVWSYYPKSPSESNVIFFSPNPIEIRPQSEGPIVTIMIIPHRNSNIHTFINDPTWYDLDNRQQQNIVVDKVTASQISGTVISESYITGRFVSRVLVPHNSSVIEIFFIEKDGVSQDEFNQILSTFRFVD